MPAGKNILGFVEAVLKDLLRKWEGHFPLENVHIRFNSKMRSRAGLCKPHQRIVELNPHLLQDPKILEEVLIHELCHLAVGLRWPYAQAHGKKWQALMLRCGFEPKRCHNLPVTKRRMHRRWEFQCHCQTHRVSTVVRNRILRGARYKCKMCRSLLVTD